MPADRAMMISLSRSFVFVANLKSASTSIEQVLKPYSEIAIEESRLGKHAPIRLILARYDWLFRERNLEEFFVFGVIRDPASYMVSLYNSHADERFSGDETLYTGRMSFDDFLSTWVPRHYSQAQPQFEKFVDEQGFLAVDFLIDFDRLSDGLETVARRTGIDALRNITQENRSQTRIEVDNLSSRHHKWIFNHFRQDYRLLQQKCNDASATLRRFSMQLEPFSV